MWPISTRVNSMKTERSSPWIGRLPSMGLINLKSGVTRL
jgi:hypothetical protein